MSVRARIDPTRQKEARTIALRDPAKLQLEAQVRSAPLVGIRRAPTGLFGTDMVENRLRASTEEGALDWNDGYVRMKTRRRR